MQGVTNKQNKTPLHVESNNVRSDAVQGENEVKPESQIENVQQDSVPKTQEADNSSNLDAEKDIVRTSSLQKSDNQSNKTPNSPKLAKKVLTTNLIATPPVTNGGFDEATWGQLDVNNWQGSVQDGFYQLTNYTGDPNHIIVPNEADFEQADRSTNGLQVGITRDTVKSLLSQGQTTIAFSKTNNQKVKAIGPSWSYAFSHTTLSKFDGSNLDVSNVTDMNTMFYDNKVSDLTSLAHWNVSNVTNMSYMFGSTSISDLKPLANWNVSNVTDMSNMFSGNQINDLTPLTNWNVSNVTDMTGMFYGNSISDLAPLAHWDVSNVTNMDQMFESNSISDLAPLAHWDVSNVTNMSWMFENNSISDLTPLTNWNVSNVTTMTDMFSNNPDLIDLRPIANWNISSTYLFLNDTKLNLTNINNTPLMQGFLKKPNALARATFITNNADLVKAITGKDLPDSTNTAKRTIVFNIPHTDPETIVQTINYKAVTTVQIQGDYNSGVIVQTYPVKESDWQLDDSKTNDAIIVNGKIHFKAVKIPHINGYKAHFVRNKLNPAMFMVSFMAVPSEEAPSKPSAPADNPNNSAWSDLDHKVVDALNQSDSGWTMPNTQPATYTVEVPADNTIDLSDLVIAEPVHAQTTTRIHVNKRFKFNKKHSIKHLKHRKRVSKLFSKRYASL